MKGKIVRGKGFRGCLNYLLAQHKGAKIIGGNMTGRDPKSLAKEFAAVRKLRPDCKKPVLHIALRMPVGEDVSAETWLKIILRLMKLMGLSPGRPWLLVKHPDQHVHLLLSRIGFGGDIWLGRWEALKLIEATQIIEKEFGLTVTPGLKGKDRKQVRITSGQIKKISRELDRGQEPEIPAKVAIAERIQQAIDQSNGTFDDFKERLEKLGVAVKLNSAKTTSHISGITFELGGVAMKGSKVARAYSWQGLNELLAERKTAYENRRTPQPTVELGPKPNERRATQPITPRVGPELGSTGNRSPKGGNPTPSPVPSAVPGIDGGAADAVPDVLLSLLAGAPVTAGVGAGTGSIISAARAVGTARRRALKNIEEDDGPGADGPTIGF